MRSVPLAIRNFVHATFIIYVGICLGTYKFCWKNDSFLCLLNNRALLFRRQWLYQSLGYCILPCVPPAGLILRESYRIRIGSYEDVWVVHHTLMIDNQKYLGSMAGCWFPIPIDTASFNWSSSWLIDYGYWLLCEKKKPEFLLIYCRSVRSTPGKLRLQLEYTFGGTIMPLTSLG